jgi:hypothetical protein
MSDAFLTIVSEANRLIRKVNENAGLLEARGTPDGDSGKSADDVKTWDFIFGGNKDLKYTISYTDGKFGAVQQVAKPMWGDKVISLPLKMGLTEALALLIEASYTDPFSNVVLRWTLHYSKDEPQYIFTIISKSQTVSVGVNTGQVRVIKRS